MEKILIGIHAPTIGMKYDAFVPADIPVGELIGIMAAGLADISDGKYHVSGHEMLSLAEPESLLNPALTLQDYNIKDGMQFYLM